MNSNSKCWKRDPKFLRLKRAEVAATLHIGQDRSYRISCFWKVTALEGTALTDLCCKYSLSTYYVGQGSLEPSAFLSEDRLLQGRELWKQLKYKVSDASPFLAKNRDTLVKISQPGWKIRGNARDHKSPKKKERLEPKWKEDGCGLSGQARQEARVQVLKDLVYPCKEINWHQGWHEPMGPS